jgi:hypothetical protein
LYFMSRCFMISSITFTNSWWLFSYLAFMISCGIKKISFISSFILVINSYECASPFYLRILHIYR